MKYINFKRLSILSFALATFTLTSCEDDDLGKNNFLIPENDVALTGTVSTDVETTFEGQTIPVTVTLDQSFESEATVEVTARLNSGIGTATILTLPAGSTTATGTVTIPTNGDRNRVPTGFDGSLEVSAVFAPNANGDVYSVTSIPVPIRILDNPPTVVFANGIVVNFTWATSPGDDYDFFSEGSILTGATGRTVERASRASADFADDTYTIFYNPFDVAGGDVEYVFSFRATSDSGTPGDLDDDIDNIVTYRGVLDAANNDPEQIYPLVSLTKTTDASGNASYTFEQLED